MDSHRAGHEEAGGKGSAELGGDTRGDHARGGDGALDLVVARHLRAVEHHGPRHVGLEAAVEAADALVLEEGLGALHHGRGARTLSGHHARLEHVEGIARERPVKKKDE